MKEVVPLFNPLRDKIEAALDEFEKKHEGLGPEKHAVLLALIAEYLLRAGATFGAGAYLSLQEQSGDVATAFRKEFLELLPKNFEEQVAAWRQCQGPCGCA